MNSAAKSTAKPTASANSGSNRRSKKRSSISNINNTGMAATRLNNLKAICTDDSMMRVKNHLSDLRERGSEADRNIYSV